MIPTWLAPAWLMVFALAALWTISFPENARRWSEPRAKTSLALIIIGVFGFLLFAFAVWWGKP